MAAEGQENQAAKAVLMEDGNVLLAATEGDQKVSRSKSLCQLHLHTPAGQMLCAPFISSASHP